MLRWTCRSIYNDIRSDLWKGGGRRDLYCLSKTENGKTTGPCGGDIGGPVIDPDDGSLVGLNTQQFVASCGNSLYPTVFTNLNFHYDWIMEGVAKWSCPWFSEVQYPTISPTFTMLPTIDPTVAPSTYATKAISVFPSISPTKNPTKPKMKKKIPAPTIMPTKPKMKKVIKTEAPLNMKKTNKKTKSTRSHMEQTFPNQSNCRWVEKLIQESVDIIKEDVSDHRFIKVKTTVQKYVNTWTCSSKDSFDPIVPSIDPVEEKVLAPKITTLLPTTVGTKNMTKRQPNSVLKTSFKGLFPTKPKSFLPDIRTTQTPTQSFPKFCNDRFESINVGNFRSVVTLWFDDKALALSTYGPINEWDTSKITDFDNLFSQKTEFNGDISGWDTSGVTTMKVCFIEATISIELIILKQNMFEGATRFNVDIRDWNVENVGSFEVSFLKSNLSNF